MFIYFVVLLDTLGIVLISRERLDVSWIESYLKYESLICF